MKTQKIVMTLAHQLRSQNLLSLSQALVRAWQIVKSAKSLIQAMNSGPVRFFFLKETGELREAVGYAVEEIEIRQTKKGFFTITFMDAIADNYRAFRLDRFVSWDADQHLQIEIAA